EAEATLTLEDLGDEPAFRRRFDRVLHVLDADAVAGGGDAVNGKLELGLADEVVIVEVGDAADPAQDIADLARLRLQHEQVGPIQLNRELPLDAGERLVDIVLDRLREVRRDAG